MQDKNICLNCKYYGWDKATDLLSFRFCAKRGEFIEIDKKITKIVFRSPNGGDIISYKQSFDKCDFKKRGKWTIHLALKEERERFKIKKE